MLNFSMFLGAYVSSWISKDNLVKFHTKADEGVFLGYSYNFVAYRVLNKRTRKIEQTFNLTFDDYYVKRSEQAFIQ